MANAKAIVFMKVPDITSKNITLFHGSKSGIKGSIKPISRDKCDFGAGFYMGTDIWQPLTLVFNFESPVLYTVKLDLSNLKVLYLQPNLIWALTVAFHRGKLEQYSDLPLYEKLVNYISGYDVIVGPIADDRMFVVLDRFFKGDITDEALIHCLSGLDLGYQYVAITEKACDRIKIQKMRTLDAAEKKDLKTLSAANRQAGIQLVDTVSKQYRRKGRYFDEIVGDWNESEFGSKTAL